MWWRSIPLGTSIIALALIALIECAGSSRYAHSLTARFQRSTRSPPSDASRRTCRDVEAPVISNRFLDQPSSVRMIVNPCCRSPRLRVRGS